MATVSGTQAASILVDDFRANQSQNIISDSDHVISLTGYVMPLASASVRTDTQPVDEAKVTVSGVGAKASGGNSDFYNRILIEPAQLDLGNVLSTQTRQIKVWNGFFVSKAMTDFQQINYAGIQVTEPVAIPYTLKAIEEVIYTVAVTTDGPPVIDAQLKWEIGGEWYGANITGRRVVVFPFGPNWKQNGYTESLEWRTDVLRSFDGSEQRRSLRTKARRSFEYSAAIFRENTALFENLLWGWQNRLYAVPVWSDKTRLTSSANQGDTVLNLNASVYSFVPGGLLVLFAGTTNYEVAEIDSVTGSTVVLSRPLEAPWSLDTSVYPANLGHLPNAVPTQRYTGNVLTASIRITTSPVETDPYTPTAAAPVLYQDIEVLTRQPNWIRPLDNTFEYAFDVIDQNTGAITWDQTESFPRIVRRYSWLLRDRAEVLAFRQMLGRLRGQAKPLWVPSWHLDFRVVTDIGSADTFIAVADNEFSSMVGLDAARNNICLRTEDGQTFYRKLVGVSSTAGVTRLQMDSTIGVSVPVSNVRALHILNLSHLATDKVDIVWRSNEVATVETTLITVKE